MKRLIDVHVHLAALPDGDNGCYIAPKLLRSLRFRFIARRQRLDLTNPRAANSRYLQRLKEELNRSEQVGQAVLLGLDGVYDDKGQLDLGRTCFLISNDYVLKAARSAPTNFLPGVSINPQRADAVDELERCVEGGAVLVKVLPNAQCFDPADTRFVRFYRAMAEHRIPLLSHVGYEFSLVGKDQSAGDPARLRVALDEGVYVIAAHACSYGLGLPEPYFETFKDFVRDYPNFYVDSSALTLPNRVRTLFLLRRHPELHERVLLGSDYPLPVFSYPALGRSFTRATRAASAFDRQALVLEGLGIGYRDFSALMAIRKG